MNFSKLNLNELRREFADDRLLVLRIRMPTGTWMTVSRECCVFSGRALCDGLTLVRKSSTECGVYDCDREASTKRGCRAMGLWGGGESGINY